MKALCKLQVKTLLRYVIGSLRYVNVTQFCKNLQLNKLVCPYRYSFEMQTIAVLFAKRFVVYKLFCTFFGG
jgi:hypothetical protein